MKATNTRIIVTSRDYERLQATLDSLPASTFPGKAALQAELERAEIVDPEAVPPQVVTMNSTVRFTMPESGKEFSLKLVYPRDAGQADSISVLAPVGTALLGLSAGDELEWPTPGGGSTTVHVEEVLYQPERSGEMHR
jgi:regulator of nucleoside diphosphate kinase